MKQLVIGCKGQVGSALFKVLSPYYKDGVQGIDLHDSLDQQFDVVHICIPYNDRFIPVTQAYLDKYLKPDGLPIIHATVAVGTSAHFGAVHSPIRGKHPDLEGGIRIFEKFFGGPRAAEASAIFFAIGIRTVLTDKAENTEAMKLWDTTYYGWNIIFEKAVHAYCERYGLDFDIVYTHANRSYNEGYQALGLKNVVRPVLDHCEGKTGGHCVIPNARILVEFDENDIAAFILKKDEEY